MRNLWKISAGVAAGFFVTAFIYGNYLVWTQGSTGDYFGVLVLDGLVLTLTACVARAIADEAPY